MRARHILLGALTALAPQVTRAQARDTLPYRDPTRPIAERVRDLVGRMTLDEKFWQTFMIPGDLDMPANDYSNGIFGLQISSGARGRGAGTQTPLTAASVARGHAERINEIQKYFVEKTRLGIPIIPFEEALHGLKSEGSTQFPQAIALAATFDTALMTRVATAIARETGSRGIRDVLSPVINVATDVRWGRVEETYGEDPLLSSLMGRAFVSAFERAGIVATPKHFIANVGEGGRDSYPIDVSQRFLDEVHFPPFVTAITEGGARSVMTAYNSIDGSPATQNRALLNGKLKGEWGFTGFVISDASATSGSTVLHHTEASTATAAKNAFESGLNVVFQSSYDKNRPYLAAFRSGTISDSIINASVSRVLRAKFELGLFEHPYVNPDSAAYWNGNAAHRALALEAARASIVLLKNDRGVLPLSRAPQRSYAVIGGDAAEARLGGYSGTGINKVSILQGIREKLGAATTVRYAGGPGRVDRTYAVVPGQQLSSVTNGQSARGLRGDYFDNVTLSGDPRMTRADPQINFQWTLNGPGRGISYYFYSVRWTGTLTVPPSGAHRIGVEANDGYRLWIDGKLVIDDWIKRSYGARLADIALAPGSTHDVKLEFFESTGNARVKLMWDAGVVDDWSAKIDSAVMIARQSDVAIVVAGLEEGEFRDRAYLKLPGHQEDLIERVAATGKPVIVVLIGGSAITMSRWLDRVPSIIDAWYPGDEGGHAVADILFGDAEPAGRLPITFPVFEGQLPLYYYHKPTGRGDDYLDLNGQPLFPFGFGLSYTTFEYSALTTDAAAVAGGGDLIVRCTVKNTGTRAGDEVAQLYMRNVLASIARPVLQLQGFQRIHLNPGEERVVEFRVPRARLQFLDRDMKWIFEPGAFHVMVGGSSRDLRLMQTIELR